mmetsp:Transcript_154270/g.494717  ORF Transcript_154270/g.494717 Transcript_154270/m.494717 type:complete len:358 (+) Transcript_154270:2639-3712(+)
MCDRSLPHARLSQEHRIVLRAAPQDANRSLQLTVAADQGVQLPFAGHGREVLAECAGDLEFGLSLHDALLGRCCRRRRRRHAAAAPAGGDGRAPAIERFEHLCPSGVGRLTRQQGAEQLHGNSCVTQQNGPQHVRCVHGRAVLLLGEIEGALQDPLALLVERDLQHFARLFGRHQALERSPHRRKLDAQAVQSLTTGVRALTDHAHDQHAHAHEALAEPSRLRLRNHHRLDGFLREALEHIPRHNGPATAQCADLQYARPRRRGAGERGGGPLPLPRPPRGGARGAEGGADSDRGHREAGAGDLARGAQACDTCRLALSERYLRRINTGPPHVRRRADKASACRGAAAETCCQHRRR